MPVPAATVTQYYTGIFRQAPSAAVSAAYQAMATPADALNSMLSAANVSVDPVIRLYQTAFNRVPDSAGMTAWVVPYSTGGITLSSIANGFTQSTEFTTLYPTSMSNSQFVGALYWNILQRAGEAAGMNGWINALNTGALTRSQVLLGFSESKEFVDKIEPNVNTFLTAAANNTATYTGSLYAQGGGTGAAYTLTTGIDTFGDANLNSIQTFNASAGTFTSLDKLTGGQSNADVLNVASALAYANPAGATVTGVENVNMALAAGGTVNTAANSGFTGVTNLTVNSTGALAAVTAAGTTAVAITSATPGGNALAVNGGSSVSLTETGAVTNDTITIGGTTAPTGAVTVANTASTAGGTAGNTITTTGGTTVSITSNLTSTSAAGAGPGQATVGAIGVTGTANTTTVSVVQSAGTTAANAVAATANTSNAVAATRGVSNAAVTIADANAGSTTAAATITSVTLQNYGNSTISSNALANLTLSATGTAAGTLGVTYGLTTGNPTSLALNLGGGSLGAITLNGNLVSTINATMSANTTLTGGIVDTGLRTINLGGTGILSFSANQFNTAVTAITLALPAGATSVAAGLNADVSGNVGLTSINFANSTANNTLTLASTVQAYTGGSGNDVITISANATKAITGGTGTDTIVLNAATGTFTATTGTNVTGFETVGFSTASTGAYNLATIGLAANATAVSLLGTAVGGLTVSGLAAGTTTFNVNAAQTGLTHTFQYAGTNGAATVATLNLNGTAPGAANGGGTQGFTAGTIVIQDANAVGAGTINIVSDASVFQGLHTITALNNTATSALTNLNITGTGSLSIVAARTSATSLTISDNATGTSATADGIVTLNTSDTLGTINYSGTHAFTIGTLNNNVANMTVTNANTGTSGVLTIGSHTDANLASLSLNGSVALTGVYGLNGAATVSGATNNSAVSLTMNGGGVKTITLGNGANTIVTGAADDVITVGTGANSITGAAGADTITVGAGHTTVDRYILNSVVGTSSDSGRVIVAGTDNDTGQDTYVNANIGTDVVRAVATTVANFNQGTNTVVGTATGSVNDGTIGSFTTNTGVIYLGGTNTFAAGDLAITFNSAAGTLNAANFRAMVQYDLTTAATNNATNTVVTGALNDVLRANTQTGTGLDSFTGGAGADNFVFATSVNANNQMAGNATTAVLNDKITDLVVGTDIITLGTGANAFGGALTFTANTVVNVNTVTALGAATYQDFDALAAAVQGLRTGVASNAVTAQAYVVTTGAITNATGFSNKTFLVINDDTAAIAAGDTWIDITGVNTTTLTAGTFAFGAGVFI